MNVPMDRYSYVWAWIGETTADLYALARKREEQQRLDRHDLDDAEAYAEQILRYIEWVRLVDEADRDDR